MYPVRLFSLTNISSCTHIFFVTLRSNLKVPHVKLCDLWHVIPTCRALLSDVLNCHLKELTINHLSECTTFLGILGVCQVIILSIIIHLKSGCWEEKPLLSLKAVWVYVKLLLSFALVETQMDVWVYVKLLSFVLWRLRMDHTLQNTCFMAHHLH